MHRLDALARLRNFLKEEEYSAIIIPSSDPHFGEYFQDYYKVLEYMSGFTGSAGTLVVTLNEAALWTDSRYFIQAASQLEGVPIELMKMKVAGTPTISQWLLSVLEEDDIVAIDENLYSYHDYVTLLDEINPLSATLIEDPFDQIWIDRPRLYFNPITYLSEDVTGESTSSKHRRLTEKLGEDLPYALIVTSCDEIAWLCNIRGTDVEYNPLALSYAIVTPSDIELFACKDSIGEEVLRNLYAQNVQLRGYEEFTPALTHLSSKYIRIYSSNRISAKNYFASLENVTQLPGVSPLMSDPTVGGTLSLMKAIKNDIELEGFRKAYKEDALMWDKLHSYIDKRLDEGDLTEYELVEKIKEFRAECPDYRGESFEPIVAYNANGALPHYSASQENSSIIKREGFLLIDTGGHYAYGTTDTTRTLPLGGLTDEQKLDYTRVLKGMIALSMAKFPKGTRGSQLDILARGPLFNAGKMFMHGTGHGIGHYLNVHEGPQSIRMEENSVSFQPGMVLSNEPAVYVENQYGIRIENTIVVRPWKTTEFGEFYEFETITRNPIDQSIVVESMLTLEEREWLKLFN